MQITNGTEFLIIGCVVLIALHQPSSMSDLSFRSFAVSDNSSSLRAVGRGGGVPASNLPTGGMRSRSSKPLLNDSSGSLESINSADRLHAMTATSMSTEKTSAVVFGLGDDPLV